MLVEGSEDLVEVGDLVHVLHVEDGGRAIDHTLGAEDYVQGGLEELDILGDLPLLDEDPS